MNKKLLTIPALILAIGITSIGLSPKASADSLAVGTQLGVGMDNSSIRVHSADNINTSDTNTGHPGNMMMRRMSGIFGTVTAVNGNTITVQSKTWGSGGTSAESGQVTPNQTTTTYTVNAAGATVTKANAASSISAIAVGDTVMVQGTVSGTSVTATKINDGVMMKGQPGSNGGATIPQGNGQPIIGGKVTAVSGNTVTITNSSNTPYTIDVTNAKITKAGTPIPVSTIAVGDSILAQGTVNGTSVTAVNVVDSASVTTTNGTTTAHTGFFGAIGSFFSKLFGV